MALMGHKGGGAFFAIMAFILVQMSLPDLGIFFSIVYNIINASICCFLYQLRVCQVVDIHSLEGKI